MKAFSAWCKRNKITFKHRRNESAAFDVWKLLQSELEAKDAEILNLLGEMAAVGDLLVEIKQGMIDAGLSDPAPVDFTGAGYSYKYEIRP